MRRKSQCVLIGSLLFCLSVPATASDDAAAPHVLIVHSYHHGFAWTDRVNDGVLETLHDANPRLDVHIEYLDAKRHRPERIVPAFTELLRGKYLETPPDIIIVSDDVAFQQILTLRGTLFPGIPLVFCGVNSLEEGMAAGDANVTGVVEDFDLPATLDLALSLQPDVRHLAVISDSTETGLLNLERFQQIRPAYEDRFTSIVELTGLAEAELRQELAGLEREHTIILLLSFYRDRDGKSFSVQEMTELIATAARVPVYSAWDFVMGHKVVGGRVVSGQQQGSVAAGLALRILDGEPAGSIPIIRVSPNLTVFDHRELSFFGIDRDRLPDDSVILNRPPSSLQKYLWLITGLVLFAAVETLLIVALLQKSRRFRIAEEELRRSKERFALAMQAATDGLFDQDLETDVVYYSPAWKQMLGYREDELENRFSTWERLTATEDVKPVLQAMQEHLEGKRERFEVEFKMRHKDGSWVDVLSRASAVFDETGKPIRVVGTHVDITRRKQAEDALRDSEERYRNMFENIQDAVYAITLDGTILDISPSIKELSRGQLTREELIGQSVYDYYPDTEARETFLEALQMTGLVNDYEMTLKNGDGTLIVCALSAKMQYDDHGRPVKIIGNIHDISERVALEKRLAQSQKMESVGRLAGGVAHDFNNMLGVILGYTEISLELVSQDDPIHRSLLEIQQAARRSADLTSQLLAFARKQPAAPRVLDLNETVDGMLTMLRRLIGENVDLIWRPGESLAPVRIDPSQVDQILANLCVNARDAIDGTGTITIETATVTMAERDDADGLEAPPGRHIMLAISDSGCGMDSETISHLFEPFYTTKDVGSGTGLGLATVYGIVKQNGGVIDVESNVGNGTTFRVLLPCSDEDDQQPEDRAEQTTLQTGVETVLVVEDEPMILEMTTTMLEKLGYRVFSHASPQAAIEFAEQHREEVQLLLTDVIMPEMNGRDLADQLRAFSPDLRCLYMSGYTGDVVAHHGVLDDRVVFIQKPFTQGDLSRKVKDALGLSS